MLARILHTYISWISGFFGWFAVYLAVTIYFAFESVQSGTGLPSPGTHMTAVLYTLAAAGLARVAVSATLHAIGTLFVPREQRGNRWLHGLGIASASPVMSLMIFCAPLTLGLSGMAPEGSMWLPLAIVCGTWLLGLVLGACITGLAGIAHDALERPAVVPTLTTADSRQDERATGFMGQVLPA